MRDRIGLFAFLLTVVVATGCSAPSQRPGRQAALYRVQPWDYNGAPGQVILTDHYAIHTTIDDPQIQQGLATVMEGALAEYQHFTPGLRLSVNPMQCYIFAKRSEWAKFTRDRTGEDAAVYLQINRGGYTIRDWYVAYLISETGTYAVAAHEGWHQYVARNFKSRLPPFLEEGIATMFETIVWDHNHRPRWVLSVNPLRAEKLQHAIASQQLWPLEKLITMHAGDVVGLSGERIETFYAQNWAFAMFMWESDHGRYRPALQRMLLDLASGNVPASTGVRRVGGENWDPATARPLLEYYLGMSLQQIEREYVAYMRRIASSAHYQSSDQR